LLHLQVQIFSSVVFSKPIAPQCERFHRHANSRQEFSSVKFLGSRRDDCDYSLNGRKRSWILCSLNLFVKDIFASVFPQHLNHPVFSKVSHQYLVVGRIMNSCYRSHIFTTDKFTWAAFFRYHYLLN
jgi:hypothetical protein